PTDYEFDNDNMIGDVTNDAQDRLDNQASDGVDNSKTLIAEYPVAVENYDNFIDDEAAVDETTHDEYTHGEPIFLVVNFGARKCLAPLVIPDLLAIAIAPVLSQYILMGFFNGGNNTKPRNEFPNPYGFFRSMKGSNILSFYR
ncbi:hypothetical protein Tco_0292861, partial [Tanacetum coccineum]